MEGVVVFVDGVVVYGDVEVGVVFVWGDGEVGVECVVVVGVG